MPLTPDEAEHYRKLLRRHRRLLSVVLDSRKDMEGACTRVQAWHHRFIGIVDFLITGNVESFRTNLSEGAGLYLTLLYRFDAGEPIDQSYVAMSSYRRIFDALAAANFFLATHLAQRMGGRTEAEKKHDMPFTRVMGYALKEGVLRTGDSARKELIDLFAGPDEAKNPENDRDEGLIYKDFRGYGVALDGIAAHDERGVDKGLAMIVEGHIRQSKKGIFRDEEGQFLCVWGVGIANLARSRGIPVRFDHELIPQTLLV